MNIYGFSVQYPILGHIKYEWLILIIRIIRVEQVDSDAQLDEHLLRETFWAQVSVILYNYSIILYNLLYRCFTMNVS